MTDQDPALLFQTDKVFRRVLFETFLAKNIQTQWADGVDIHVLERSKSKKQLLVTNCKFVDCNNFADHIYTVNPSYYGMMFAEFQYRDVPPVKNFNCFSNRFDIFRQSWFYHLVRRGWLDQGWVSFNCELSAIRTPDNSFVGLTSKEIFHKAFQEYNSVFAAEHQKVKDLVPFKNFQDTGNLTDLVLKSKFSIVLETWFHGNHCTTYSEKTMRCLQLPRPWLLFSTQYAVDQLRTWGFDVMDDIVDHSYDQLANSIDRQMAILDQAEQLFGLDITKVGARLHQACEKNLGILRSWHQDWLVNMLADYELAKQKAKLL